MNFGLRELENQNLNDGRDLLRLSQILTPMPSRQVL